MASEGPSGNPLEQPIVEQVAERVDDPNLFDEEDEAVQPPAQTQDAATDVQKYSGKKSKQVLQWNDVTGSDKYYKARGELVPVAKLKWVGSEEGQVRPIDMDFVESLKVTLSTPRPVSGYVEALLYEAAGDSSLPLHKTACIPSLMDFTTLSAGSMCTRLWLQKLLIRTRPACQWSHG